MTELDVQTRLTQLNDDAPHGPAAHALLQCLSIFLTERFDWNAIHLLDPSAWLHVVGTLLDHDLLHSSTPPASKPWYRWHRKFWLDAEVVAFFQPAPTEEEQHFARHAAHLLIAYRGIPQRALDLYVALVQWTLHNKPEIGLAFAQIAANRYGGTDPRLKNIVLEAARGQHRIDAQVPILVKLAHEAMQRDDYETAEAWYTQAVRFEMPLTVTDATHQYLHALKLLGHLAFHRDQPAQAQIFYERAIAERERLLPGTTIHRDLLLSLCTVTRKQGDEAAYRYYNAQVAAHWLPGLRWFKTQVETLATALDPVPRQRALFAAQLNRSIERRFGVGYILWHWGRFEYEHGNQAEGCALCQAGLLELRKGIDDGSGLYHWWAHIDAKRKRYIYRMQFDMQYGDELQTYLSAMGCDEA